MAAASACGAVLSQGLGGGAPRRAPEGGVSGVRPRLRGEGLPGAPRERRSQPHAAPDAKQIRGSGDRQPGLRRDHHSSVLFAVGRVAEQDEVKDGHDLAQDRGARLLGQRFTAIVPLLDYLGRVDTDHWERDTAAARLGISRAGGTRSPWSNGAPS